MDADAERRSPGEHVVVVDDEHAVLRVVGRLLQRGEFIVSGFDSASRALEHLAREGDGVDAILTDLHLSGMSGLDLLRESKQRWPEIPVILMTGRATVSLAVESMKRGAYDFLVKPFDPADTIVSAVRRAVEYKRLLERNRFLERQIALAGRFDQMVGSSAAMRRVFAVVESVAPTGATVLLLGESGTGKELVASAVHKRSQRSNQPFVVINCAALTESVIDSELFGHVAGAFTGATTNRRGLFQEASGGTLFLDEIGELPPATQVRLLRAIQQGEIRPVGSNEARRVDVRLVAATNRDLLSEVRAGRFREDLYYRLNVVSIDLPPLRARTEDIPALARHFIDKYSAKLSKKVTLIEADALDRLTRYPWPGNVRELENAIERAVILAKGETLTADVLPPAVLGREPAASNGAAPFVPQTLAELEREHILRTLEQTHWQIEGPRGACRILGLKPATLRSRMQKLGIRRPLP